MKAELKNGYTVVIDTVEFFKDDSFIINQEIPSQEVVKILIEGKEALNLANLIFFSPKISKVLS